MHYSISQRGSATAVVAAIAAVFLVGGVIYYFSMKSTPLAEENIEVARTTGEEEITIKKDGGEATIKYSGAVLAGTSAPLLDFTKADFDAAVKSDKVVVLYFFANWCPNCAVEFPVMQSVFNELTTDRVVGFRVNYNDNQTDSNEKALAREHGIAYQHTKVFLKKGQQVLKSPEIWTKDRYLTEIQNALTN